MELKNSELKIFYGDPMNEKLDKAIKETLKKFGYSWWASGFDIETGVRDLAFDNRGYAEEKPLSKGD